MNDPTTTQSVPKPRRWVRRTGRVLTYGAALGIGVAIGATNQPEPEVVTRTETRTEIVPGDVPAWEAEAMEQREANVTERETTVEQREADLQAREDAVAAEQQAAAAEVAPAEEPAAAPDSGLEDGGWVIETYTLGEDFAGDFEASARITNTGSHREGALFTLTILDGSDIVATLSGSAQAVDQGQTATVEFWSTDDFRSGDLTLDFQVDGQF